MFRGLAIAGMVLVNNPGSWAYVYAPLRHAEWHGFTPTDQIFPAFLFAVGAALPYTLDGFREGLNPRNGLAWRVGRRVILLIALGLVLNFSKPFFEWVINGNPIDLEFFRIMGVLQRIGLAYLLAAVIVANLSPVLQAVSAVAILFCYWVALTLVPVPGYGPGDLSPEGSLAAYVDRSILTLEHMYQWRFEPEGLLGTLPAAVTVLIGYAAGMWIKRSQVSSMISMQLLLAGFVLASAGHSWGLVFPVNKPLWTSSYVMLTGGISCILMAACYEIMEVRRWRWIGWPLQVMGVNAIALFFASGIVARLLYVVYADETRSLHKWIYDTFFVPWAGALNGSLAFAISMVLGWWIVLYVMYRRRWFFRL